MYYLLTGGAGFIGSHLADRLLLNGHSVVVVDNFNDYYDVKIKENNVLAHKNSAKYTLYKADIECMDTLDSIFANHKFDAIIHLAARAGVRPSLENPIGYIKSNILGTTNILECMRKYQCKKIIFASSSSVYGNCKAKKFSENLKITKPISPYAATKSACEQLIYTWHHLYDIKAVILRFFTVYGPRQRPDLAIRKFIKLIKQNQPIPVYGDGSSMRDYTYIDDIISGICSALHYEDTSYEIINLGGGSPITLSKMIKTIESTLQKKAKINKLPMQMGDVNKTISDISKAKRLLKYNPQVSFKAGIKKFIEWSSKETYNEN